jgi:selT/selW/selH-like putative selenoprotein
VEAELKASYPDAHIELIKGSNGIFDVVCNGKLAYSKDHTKEHRFPKEGEVSELIKQEIG